VGSVKCKVSLSIIASTVHKTAKGALGADAMVQLYYYFHATHNLNSV
jgi:hypothetical protein